MWRRWRARRAAAAVGWRDLSFLVVDFETTGLDVRRAQPLSVGWVPVREGRVELAEAGYRRISIHGPVPTASMGIHGLLPEDLRGASDVIQVGEVLHAALHQRLLVAHGAFMEVAMLRRCGITVPRGDVIDTMGLVRGLARLDGRDAGAGVSLGAAAARARLPVLRPHHAFGDALTTAGLFLALATGLERHAAASRGALVRLGRSV